MICNLKFTLVILACFTLIIASVAGDHVCNGDFTPNYGPNLKPDGSFICQNGSPHWCTGSECKTREGLHFISLGGCQLYKSKNRGKSNQQCVEYYYLGGFTNKFFCMNSGKIPYICEGSWLSKKISFITCPNSACKY